MNELENINSINNKFQNIELIQYLYNELTPNKRKAIEQVLFQEKKPELVETIYGFLVDRKKFDLKNSKEHIQFIDWIKNSKKENHQKIKNLLFSDTKSKNE